MQLEDSLRSEREHALRVCLARMRRAPLDFRLRVEAGELLVDLGEVARGVRVLKSCADYFTLAGFPLRALWALKLLERFRAEPSLVDRGLQLLARHYAHREGAQWGEPIYEMPLPRVGELSLAELPEDVASVVAEVDRRATDIISGTSFPDRLPRFPLLSDLSAATFVEVARAIRLRRVPDGFVLVEQGEVAAAVQLLVTGLARTLRRQDDGVEAEAGIYGEGEMLGEMALLTGSPRRTTVVARGRVNALEIPESVVTDLGGRAHELRQALARQICHRTVEQLVRERRLFGALEPAVERTLITAFEARLVDAGEVIIREGQADALALHVILDGLVSVVVTRDGMPHEVARLREGELIGEIALVRRAPATATCRAVRRTVLMSLTAEAFDRVVREAPALADAMAQLGDRRILDNIFSLA
ncbi:MAG: cyclic nucleotide-binding domain-containing protein [Myxococcales bacterium]|nr:cyclic nucleotide-binding domain-containing protein [Myxococcales bacterium]